MHDHPHQSGNTHLPNKPTQDNPFDVETIDDIESRAPQSCVSRENRGPDSVFWLFYLYFKPKRFFSYFMFNHTVLLAVLGAWIFGMSRVAGSALNRNSWLEFWLQTAVMGAASALVLYHIGGLWYRIRINWCGGSNLKSNLAVRVYIFASLIFAVPQMLAYVIQSSIYLDPLDAKIGWPRWIEIAMLPMFFWSFYTSYRGVTTVFDVRRLLATIWFLILPTLSMIAVFVIIYIVENQTHRPPPPDISSSFTREFGPLTFEYPINWTIDTDHPKWDPDRHITIRTKHYGHVRIILHDISGSPNTQSIFTSAFVRRERTDTNDVQNLHATTFGMFSGAAIDEELAFKDKEYRLYRFSSNLKNGLMLEFQLLCRLKDETRLEPGIELIRNSIRFKP